MMRPNASGGRTSPVVRARTGSPVGPIASPHPKTPISSTRANLSKNNHSITNGRTSPTTGRRSDSPLSVPKRNDLKVATPVVRRPPASQGPPSNGSISSVPTRDAVTGRRVTPTRQLNATGSVGGSGPPTPHSRQQSARSGTQPTPVAPRSARSLGMASSSGPTPVRALGDKAVGQKVVNSSRVDAEMEYEKRRKRLEKIAQVAKLVEKEANTKARDETRFKPEMMLGPGGAPKRDAELCPAMPHRRGSPMRRMGSLGSAVSSLNGTPKVRETSPATAASKRQFPSRNTSPTLDLSKTSTKPTGTAKAVGGTLKNTQYSNKMHIWELGKPTGTPESARINRATLRVASPINKQQDPSVKAPTTCKGHVQGSPKDSNPAYFACGSSGAGTDSPVNSARTSPSRRGAMHTPASHPDMMTAPLYTKPSMRPGYMAPAGGMSGVSANHDYHRPTHNILGLTHTDKAGPKFESNKNPVEGKRCGSADKRTSRGSAMHSTGNPSEMSPSTSDRRRSADFKPSVRVSSPIFNTSAGNMLSFENRPAGSSTAAAANRLRSASPGNAAAISRSAAAPSPNRGTVGTSRSTTAGTPGGVSHRSLTPSQGGGAGAPGSMAPRKRATSPSFQTSSLNPLSISGRGGTEGVGPKVSVTKYKKTVALNRSSPNMLTERAEGSHTPPRATSTTRRKYTNASTLGGVLNWATDNGVK